MNKQVPSIPSFLFLFFLLLFLFLFLSLFIKSQIKRTLYKELIKCTESTLLDKNNRSELR